jgi:twitching motility protein PilT
VSLRLVPRKDGRGRAPACEVLINTAAVADNIRDIERQLSIPDLISEGSVRTGCSRSTSPSCSGTRTGRVVRERAVLLEQPERVRAARLGRRGSSDRTFSDITGAGKAAGAAPDH